MSNNRASDDCTEETDDFKKLVESSEYLDSGFISGQISEPLSSSDDVIDPRSESKSSDRNQFGSSGKEETCLDSGVDLSLSKSLSSFKLSDGKRNNFDEDIVISSAPEPTLNIGPKGVSDIPPLAILFQQDDDGDTQLHIAAVRGCEASVRTLVRACPLRAWLDVPNACGHTALHLAVLAGHDVVARMLVFAGAEVGCRDCAGETALHAAAAAGNVPCLMALLAPVPEHPQRHIASVLNQKNYNGETCVHLATLGGHTEALHTLVFYGADINAREGLGGFTALHLAAQRGDASMTRFILERCAGAQLGTQNFSGRTARRLAARTPAAAVFASFKRNNEDSASSSEEDDSDDDDEDFESEFMDMTRNLFKENNKEINVA